MTAEAETSDRIRQVAGGTSGSAARRSSRAKAASSAAATARATQVRGAVQPAERVRLDAEHQRQQPADQGQRAGDVEPPQRTAAARRRG